MRYFIDCEFEENGKTIDLISIAVLAEDGRSFVRYNYDYDQDKATPWLKQHVLPHLPFKPPMWTHINGKFANDYVRYHLIGSELIAFIGDDKEPEFWGDFAAYDWVAVCQLFGPMIDLPKGWPMFIRDVQQLRKMLNVPKFTVHSHGEHDALTDAKECKARHDVLWSRWLEIVTWCP